MKTSEMAAAVAKFWSVCLVAGCAVDAGEPGGSVPQDDVAGAQTEELATCGPKPHTSSCKFATCSNHHWLIKNKSDGTLCSDDCGSGTCSAGVCSSRVTGSVHPSYYILTIVYSPPGTSGGGPKSTVTYAGGSSTGTEVSTTSSFNSSITISAEESLTISPLTTLTLNESAGYACTKSTTDTLKLTKKEERVISGEGGLSDRVDHDRDAIWLWLNPSAAFQVCGSHADWTFTTENGEAMDIQYVYVRDLKNPSLMPPGVKAELEAAGITPALYPQILSHDPFANGGTAIDPARFVQTTTTFPYEPPFEPGDVPEPLQLSVGNETSTDHNQKHEEQYSVGFDVTGSHEFTQLLSAKLKVSTLFTWTDSTSTTSSSSSTETATVRVTGPAFGYTGPTNMAVYYDMIYKSFMFVPITHSANLVGVASGANAQPLVNEAVTLDINGVRYHTVTGRDGRYRFFDLPSGSAAVQVSGLARSVQIGSVQTSLDFDAR